MEYEAPLVEVVNTVVEKGFASSEALNTNGIPEWQPGNEW